MAIPEFIIEEALRTLAEGIKNFLKMKAQTKAQLVKVYQEIRHNRFVLEQSGLLETHRIAIDDKTFISVAKKLANKEISPLYKFNKRGIFFPDSKKAIALRKTQYAINYIVEQIGYMKDLPEITRNRYAKDIRLLPRLRTLDKHLAALEKTLRPIDKRKKIIKKCLTPKQGIKCSINH